jgi:hypothetical protein
MVVSGGQDKAPEARARARDADEGRRHTSLRARAMAALRERENKSGECGRARERGRREGFLESPEKKGGNPPLRCCVARGKRKEFCGREIEERGISVSPEERKRKKNPQRVTDGKGQKRDGRERERERKEKKERERKFLTLGSVGFSVVGLV